MQKYFSFLMVFGFMVVSSVSNAQAWVSDAETYIKTLTRPVDIYTWEPRASFGSKPGEIVQPNDSRAYQLLVNYANLFSDPKEALKYEGPNGIYFATDPFVSREWGSNQRLSSGAEWSVMRVTLPQGTRFLDGRMQGALKPALQQFVSSKGCSAVSMRDLLDVKINVEVDGVKKRILRPDRVQCWHAYTEIVKTLRVQALAKFFYALGPDYCPTHNGTNTDFIVVDPAAVSNYAVFVPEIPNPDTAASERTFIRDYWLLAKKVVENKCAGTQPSSIWENRFSSSVCTFFVTSPYQYQIPWSLPATDLSSPALKQKIETQIYGCGNYREDKP